jgi:hypothetical protein
MINISYQVLKNALTCTQLGKSGGRLRLESQDLAVLSKALEGLNHKSLCENFEQSLSQLFQACDLNASCLDYFKLAIPDLAADVDRAMQSQTLDKLFALHQEEPQNRILFSTGQTMSPTDFHDFIEEFKSCRYASDQLSMIQLSIRSLMDLKNILLAVPLNNELTNQVFNLFSDTDLAAFYQRYVIPYNQEDDTLAQEEIYLHKLLTAYLKTQTLARQALVRSLAAQLIIAPESFS